MKYLGKPYLIETMLLGSSLANLAKYGSADRELQYYDLLSKQFDLVLLEYANPINGIHYKKILPISNNKWINSIFNPLLHANRFRGLGVVRSKQLFGSWAAWILSKVNRKKFVLRCGYIWSRSVFHEHPNLHPLVYRIVLLLERLLVKCADGLIYGSQDIAKFYQKYSNRPSVIIPNGFDTESFLPKPEISKDVDFIYTGRLIKLKRIERMLENVGLEKTLIVAGGGPLAALVENKRNIIYLGVVPNPDLPNVLNRARIFISLSATEGSPKCLIEAILCGLYPVVSDIPAHRLLIEELGYGQLIGEGQQFSGDLASSTIDSTKLEIFREQYSLPSIVSREVSFCSQFVQ
jgi:glycosyltransferase involved in cell wall biosynthesis